MDPRWVSGVDPDLAFYLNPDTDSDSGGSGYGFRRIRIRIQADPDPDQILDSQKVEFLHKKHT